MPRTSLLLLVIVGGAVLAGGAGYAFFMPQPAGLAAVAIRSVSVTASEIRVNADFVGSAMSYAGHKAELSNKTLIIEILMRNGFPFGKMRSPEFTVKNEYPELSKILLKGRSPDETRLIWSR